MSTLHILLYTNITNRQNIFITNKKKAEEEEELVFVVEKKN
jgi:hypothetical protein